MRGSTANAVISSLSTVESYDISFQDKSTHAINLATLTHAYVNVVFLFSYLSFILSYNIPSVAHAVATPIAAPSFSVVVHKLASDVMRLRNKSADRHQTTTQTRPNNSACGPSLPMG
ncbi:hypothetical protein COCSADRAFT_295960 [Bipolaris sorokiniana ND90Pr]|uniref:Uncharacterized protein n=1 Tax=Cochliobolus sativus (strain ND90Pr / ATCC 201652) TaxID=665912 RepID=M2TBG6_COCSN|nr:uncharacterized protein COCSADRAFT_295960 [Bipolaris sorokiniana ND90Pr]EMD66212.1 hypothetical protein COCSADRAFT_295960 [Bipolaris sorokiniana ND90Pr]